MSTRTSPWPAGVPCWADLSAPDMAVAQRFYGDVLGWSFTDSGPEYGGYVTASVRGLATAGMAPHQPGRPPTWTLYLASDDADATAAAVARHGGTVHAEPFDVGPLGRMLVGADPTSAVFGVWQAGEHIGCGLVNEPGGLVWEDLRSPDPDAARSFYCAVFGYRTEPLADAGPDYALFSLPDEPAPLGGMGGMLDAPEGTPPHWLVYFGVPDVTAAAAAAERRGGRVLLRDLETPYGRMAGLTDPGGASFWVVETDGSDQPDRSG